MEKIVSGFENYVINDSGDNDKSVWSTKNQQWMKSRPLPSGYIRICFTVDGKHYERYLHRLLAEAFIDNPDNKPTVNHKNHIRNDNRIENLEWATRPEQNDEIMRKNVSNARTGQHNSPETEYKKGRIPWNKGKKWSEEVKNKISKSKKERSN